MHFLQATKNTFCNVAYCYVVVRKVAFCQAVIFSPKNSHNIYIPVQVDIASCANNSQTGIDESKYNSAVNTKPQHTSEHCITVILE